MPGRPFRFSVHRKNEERKKYACKALPVSIKLTKEVMAFRVSISLSLPIGVYLSTPVVSLQALQTRLQTTALPPSWIIAPSSSPESLVLCKLSYDSSHSIASGSFMVTIDCHFGWRVMLCSNHIDASKNEFLSSFPPSICTFYDLVRLLESLESCRIYSGNGEARFLIVVRHRNSTLQGVFVVYNIFSPCICTGQDVAVLEAHITSAPTVRHKECQFIMSLDGTGVRCQQCVRHRASLLVQHQRLQSSSKSIQPSSSVNHHFLSVPQLVSRLQNVHHGSRLVSKQCERLTKKLEEECLQRGVAVDNDTHEGLMEIVKQNGDMVLPPKSFQKLFWQQQKAASSKGDSRGMRWHPLRIRWCLYIHHRSSGAYQVRVT